MNKNDRQILRRILGCTGKKYKICVEMILLIISSVISVLQPLTSRRLLDDGILGYDFTLICFWSVCLITLTAVNDIIYIMAEKIRCDIKSDLVIKLFQKFIAKMNVMSINYFNQKSNTEIYTNMSNDINNMALLVDSGVFLSVSQGLNMAGGMIGLAIINWKLSFIVFIMIPFKYYVIRYFARQRDKIVREYMDEHAGLSKQFDDFTAGIKEIRIYNIFDRFQRALVDKQKTLMRLEKKMNIQTTVNVSFDQFLLQSISVLLYMIGSLLVISENMSVGSLMAFIAYSSYAISPLSAMFNLGITMSNVLPAAERYFSVLDLKYDETEEGTDQIKGFQIEEILFDHIQFFYGEKQVLDDVSFEVKAGEILILTGENGSGKTTVLNLLLRFIKPHAGHIYCNGKDIGLYDIEVFREKISLVGPGSYIFNGTVIDNILLGISVEQEKINHILEIVSFQSFCEKHGYGYKLDNNGDNLSTGQRQKILLARAMIHNSDVIIFDEATANLDFKSRKQIYKTLRNEVFRNKIIIIVTHHNDIDFGDKVIQLDKGKIVCGKENKNCNYR